MWRRRSQVSSWSVEDLRVRLAALDPQMEQEMEEIRQRYQAKRKPILDAIEAKKRRQQHNNLWLRPHQRWRSRTRWGPGGQWTWTNVHTKWWFVALNSFKDKTQRNNEKIVPGRPRTQKECTFSQTAKLDLDGFSPRCAPFVLHGNEKVAPSCHQELFYIWESPVCFCFFCMLILHARYPAPRK